MVLHYSRLVLRSRGNGEKVYSFLSFFLSLFPSRKEIEKERKKIQSMEEEKNKANDEYKRGDYSASLRSFSLCLELDPTNDFYNSIVLANRAACYMAIGEMR